MQHDQKLGFFLPRNVRLFIFKILINIIHHIIRIKWKNHMTDSVDTGKAVYKIQYLFIIKTLSILGIKENSAWCVCVLSQSCPTLCSPPGSSVHGILQARILEWVAMPFPRGSSWPRDWTHVSWVVCTGRWVLYHYRHQKSCT